MISEESGQLESGTDRDDKVHRTGVVARVK